MQWHGCGPLDIYFGKNNPQYYNTSYTSFNNDCANFGCQCLIAGGLDFNKAPYSVLHSNGNKTIPNVDSLAIYLDSDHITKYRNDIMIHVETFDSTNVSSSAVNGSIPEWFIKGDIALLGKDNDYYAHTIIKHTGDGTESKFGAHTNNRHDFKLSQYIYSGSTNQWCIVTYCHVVGSTLIIKPTNNKTLTIGDTIKVQTNITNNTINNLNPITNIFISIYDENDSKIDEDAPEEDIPSSNQLYTTSFLTSALDSGKYKIKVETLYSNGNETRDSIDIRIIPKIEITEPTNNSKEIIKPSNNKEVKDILEVKVKVSKIKGVYPDIKIKIDDIYVSSSDVILKDSLYIYYWDMSTVNTSLEGKKFNIVAEIDGDTENNSSASVYISEAILFEDFESLPDFANDETSGWKRSGTEYPIMSFLDPWFLAFDPINSEERSCKSLTGYTTSQRYTLESPAFTVPANTDNPTIVDFKTYFHKTGVRWSFVKLFICNSNGDILNGGLQGGIMIPSIDDVWWDCSYDLTEYAGQTIILRWDNYHAHLPYSCNMTTYGIDDVTVHTTPDTDEPSIDFIAGNTANVNSDMNLSLKFSDNSSIVSVFADYSVEGESGIITMSQGKNSYTYVGILPARGHSCIGNIKFRIKDSVGNKTVSEEYQLAWSDVQQVLDSPSNVQMFIANDSTVTSTWDLVLGATHYKVYSSYDPYNEFIEDTLGTFNNRSWSSSISGNKRFYKIVAYDDGKNKVNNLSYNKKNFKFNKPIDKRKQLQKINSKIILKGQK